MKLNSLYNSGKYYITNQTPIKMKINFQSEVHCHDPMILHFQHPK